MSDFEQIPEIAERIKRSKMELKENGFYWSPEWDSQSCCDQDFVNNFKKGWNARQGEIEKLENELSTTKQVLGNVIDMEVAKVDNLKTQLNNMEASYIEKKKVEELQGRIDEALEDLEYPTAPWDETIASVIRVVRGAND